MRDVYDAIGRPHLMAMGNRTDAPGCLVEQADNAALNTSLREAEALLLARFEAVTLAALAAEFHARSEENTAEIQSVMRISYAVICLKKQTKPTTTITRQSQTNTAEVETG